MIVRILGLGGVLALWELAACQLASPLFPPISQVIPVFVSLLVTGDLVTHSTISLARILVGFLLATGIGFVLAVAIHLWQPARLALMPIVDAMRPVAALTIFPLLILIFGLGLWSKVFVIFWTAWPAILLNTAHGLDTVDKSTCEAACLDGAGNLTLLRFISIPLAMPVIVTGLRIGLSGGWISLVSAEMLGSSRGLGYAILAYSQTFRFPEMYAIILTIALLGLSMNVAMGRVQQFTEGGSNVSPFVHFHDRAVGFIADGLLSRSTRQGSFSGRSPTGPVR